MAVQPPAPQPAPSPAPPPGAPAGTTTAPAAPAKKSGCLGCGGGCLGCLGVLVVLVLLFVAGGWYFFVREAQAGVNAPASLLVFGPKVEIGTGKAPTCGQNDSTSYRLGIPGEQLTAGTTVRTDHTGRAAIQFPDGSLTRISPDSTVTVTAAQLSKDGNLQSASLEQRIGRTFSNVQKLIGGAGFKVGGHAVSAEVRGTEFEVLVRPDCTNLVKVFVGSVAVSGKSKVTVNAGQEIDADKNGQLSPPRPIRPEPLDPFALATQCTRAVSTGTNAGTVQTTTGPNLSTGETGEVDYTSPGGTVSVALCYPGSTMTLTVIDPGGVSHASRNTSPPVQFNLNGPPGKYRALVKGISVPGGEPYVVAFATNSGCSSEPVDTDSFVRQTVSNAQMAEELKSAGVTLQVVGTSPTSAKVSYYSNVGGQEISWTIVFYAAPPNLGVVLTEFTFRGINLTTQVVSRITSAAGTSVSSIPTDFTIDRVYSCAAAEGNVMVIEGHR